MFYYESILDAIPYPVSVTDNDMNWKFLNKAVLDLAKLKKEDVLGKHCSAWNADICNTEGAAFAWPRPMGAMLVLTSLSLSSLARSSWLMPLFCINRSGEKMGHIEVIQDITDSRPGTNGQQDIIRPGKRG